jgi:hypothetical protein
VGFDNPALQATGLLRRGCGNDFGCDEEPTKVAAKSENAKCLRLVSVISDFNDTGSAAI